MRGTISRDRAFRVYKILGEHSKIDAAGKRLDLRVVLVHGRRRLQHLGPFGWVYIELCRRPNRHGRLGLREIIHGVVNVQLLELSFLIGERLAGALVSLVSREPHLMAIASSSLSKGRMSLTPWPALKKLSNL